MIREVRLALIVAGLLASQASAELITNGSFETGDFTGWTVSAGFTGVNSSGGPGGYSAQDGLYYAYLGNVGGLGTISQTFATSPGGQYTLSYYLASNGTTPNEFRTDVNGVTLIDQTDISSQPYTHTTFSFTASGATSTVTFFSRNDPDYLALDNVSVNAASVPEPASGLLWAVAGIGMTIVRFRRRACGA